MRLVREQWKSPFLFTDDSSDLLDRKVEAVKNRGERFHSFNKFHLFNINVKYCNILIFKMVTVTSQISTI